MVKLENVNKYFNRNKNNEIHAINNTSLHMESAGLVALLGPSGCGKTTLLNAIGGLDKVGSGNIYINGQKLTSRHAGAVDKIRNLNIGYIFQDYNLVDNMTVFDNVAIALKMAGVKDSKEIEQKVGYVLEKVGMYRYRNRYADMLSGGERQRVGIARAIVKDPAIIIADEPTGNLDSENTLAIMNIIKAISVDKLVIMVTHEEELAKFYASRIIRIMDGRVISDEAGDSAENLDYRLENKIYLKDIRDHKRLKTEHYNIDFYNASGGKVDMDVVIRNGCIYIRTNNKEDRIEVVDDHSAVEMLDEHYRQISKDEAPDVDFDPMKLAFSGPRKYRSIFKPFRAMVNGFRAVSNYNVLRKLLLVGFFIAAMFVTYSVSSIFGVMDITDDEFVGADKSYLTVISKTVSPETFAKYEADENYKYVMPGDSMIVLHMPFDEYFQTRQASAQIRGSLSDYEKLTVNNVAFGRLPEAPTEIVIDKMILSKVIEEQRTKAAGYGSLADFIDGRIVMENIPELTIVGISDIQSPCIYADREMFVNILANAPDTGYNAMEARDTVSSVNRLIDYNLKSSEVTLQGGAWPVNDYEVMVHDKNKEAMALNSEISVKVGEKKLKVVGYYTDKQDSDFMLVNNNTVKYDLITKTTNLTLCPADKAAAMKQLKSEKVNVKDTYEESKAQYRKQMWDSIFSALIMAAVILAVSLVEIFLIIRASFLSRVKEIGVYRAIGVKKWDIYRMFASEIFAITTLAGLPGFAVMSYIVYKLSGMVYFKDMFLVDPLILLMSLAIIYLCNMIFGLLPVFRIIRKTPAAILSRKDT